MKLTKFNISTLIIGFSFLYLPIICLVVYSFNKSRLVTVWGGFSTHWYVKLLEDQQLLDAAWISLRLALMSATIASILGTMAAIALSRKEHFIGKSLFTGMIYTPIVMPDVISGLALLLFFISLGVNRGLTTLTIAHTTFCMCFVCVIVQSRLANYDKCLEEAAQDLGCKPYKTFFVITLPIIFPSIISGWMLAFTLSLDDLVIASFTQGPGSTTLPMKIYSQARLGVSPEINAVSTIIIGIVTTGIIIAYIIGNRSNKKKKLK